MKSHTLHIVAFGAALLLACPLAAHDDPPPLPPFFIGSGLTTGLIVKIFADGVEVGSGTVDGSENYSIQTSVLTPATYTITATLTDEAGNESAPSAGLSVTIV